MNSKHAGILVVGTIGALAVCGSRTASAQSTPDPCKLLTQAQVSAAVGMSVGAGEPIGSKGCQWSSPTSPGVRATLVLWDATGWETMKTPLPGVTKVPATGIGEEAFYATVGTLTTLSVKHGRTVFIVRIYGIQDQSKQKSVEKALAGNVVAKL